MQAMRCFSFVAAGMMAVSAQPLEPRALQLLPEVVSSIPRMLGVSRSAPPARPRQLTSAPAVCKWSPLGFGAGVCSLNEPFSSYVAQQIDDSSLHGLVQQDYACSNTGSSDTCLAMQCRWSETAQVCSSVLTSQQESFLMKSLFNVDGCDWAGVLIRAQQDCSAALASACPETDAICNVVQAWVVNETNSSCAAQPFCAADASRPLEMLCGVGQTQEVLLSNCTSTDTVEEISACIAAQCPVYAAYESAIASWEDNCTVDGSDACQAIEGCRYDWVGVRCEPDPGLIPFLSMPTSCAMRAPSVQNLQCARRTSRNSCDGDCEWEFAESCDSSTAITVGQCRLRNGAYYSMIHQATGNADMAALALIADAVELCPSKRTEQDCEDATITTTTTSRTTTVTVTDTAVGYSARTSLQWRVTALVTLAMSVIRG
mmetsp:Transcript_23410/g.43070  ORF Transcript_23410/g.43070 Transcript_23410/m.43070 type:complete len:430 (-) Transcript_23410:83-1372(-)